ncbi:hypothetical protein HDU82_006039 [Entophlyctis luteolus]|nr:hypothetical protein HDU82_006039 [Entophlyctis luteolus]
MSLFLAAIDATIVASAEGAITAELGKQELLPWIGSVFLMTSTLSAATAGNLADAFGIKVSFLGLNVLFVAGCAICGAASSMEVLIAGRAIAGFGAGGLLALCLIMMGEVVSAEKFGFYIAGISAIWGVSAVLGPLIGGAFADGGVWRWCFYINLPICAMATPILISCLWKVEAPSGDFKQKFLKLDLFGYASVLVCLVCFITALQQGGVFWSWGSPQVIVLLVLAVIALGVFVWNERNFAPFPMAPPALLADQNVVSLMTISFAAGAVYYSLLYYLAIFFQINYGVSAIISGVYCIPFLVGLMAGSIGASNLVAKLGRYWHLMMASALVLMFFTLGVSFFNEDSSIVEIIFVTFFVGLPSGVLIQLRLSLLGLYIGAKHGNIASGLSQFLITLGGALGVAIVGAIQNNISAITVSESAVLMEVMNSTALQTIARTQLLEIREVLADAGSGIPRAGEALQQLIDAYNAGYAVSMRVLLGMAVMPVAAVLFLREREAPGRGSLEEVAL